MNGLQAQHIADLQAAIHAAGQSILVMESGGPRPVVARVKMLSAAELANCAELYSTRVTVAATDFPDKPPRKGLVLLINGVRCGVMEVLEMRPSNQLAGWTLGVKG
jgi:hypothetical protein